MQKIKFLMFAVIAASNLAFNAHLAAAPCYGTHMPKRHKWFAGIEYNSIIERDLENNNGRIKNSDQFIMLSYGLFDCLSIDLKGGTGKITYKDSQLGDQNFSHSFAGAYGFRLKLYESRDETVKIVGGFQHISVHPRKNDTLAGKYSIVADEWQGSCIGSIRIEQFIPYVGVKCGTYDLIRWIDDKNRKRYKSEDNAGLVLGMDWFICENLKINLEYHLLDEQAASISLGFDF